MSKMTHVSCPFCEWHRFTVLKLEATLEDLGVHVRDRHYDLFEALRKAVAAWQ